MLYHSCLIRTRNGFRGLSRARLMEIVSLRMRYENKPVCLLGWCRAGKPLPSGLRRYRNDRTVWHLPVLAAGTRLIRGIATQTIETSREQKGLIKALVRFTAVIEFDLQGNVLTVNERFLEAMGFYLEQSRASTIASWNQVRRIQGLLGAAASPRIHRQLLQAPGCLGS